jgi:hypothetical protein
MCLCVRRAFARIAGSGTLKEAHFSLLVIQETEEIYAFVSYSIT